MLSLGAVGYREAVLLLSSSSSSMLANFDLLSALGALLASGILTLCAALIAIYGVWQRDMRALKIYCLVVFCAIGIQFTIGGFLLSADASQVRDRWEAATPAQRQDFQSLLNCCGFDTWLDSIGKLDTPCPQLPQPGQPTPRSCKAGIQSFLEEYVRPAATAAIVIAVFELCALLMAIYMVFKKKQSSERYNAFEDI